MYVCMYVCMYSPPPQLGYFLMRRFGNLRVSKWCNLISAAAISPHRVYHINLKWRSSKTPTRLLFAPRQGEFSDCFRSIPCGQNLNIRKTGTLFFSHAHAGQAVFSLCEPQLGYFLHEGMQGKPATPQLGYFLHRGVLEKQKQKQAYHGAKNRQWNQFCSSWFWLRCRHLCCCDRRHHRHCHRYDFRHFSHDKTPASSSPSSTSNFYCHYQRLSLCAPMAISSCDWAWKCRIQIFRVEQLNISNYKLQCRFRNFVNAMRLSYYLVLQKY